MKIFLCKPQSHPLIQTVKNIDQPYWGNYFFNFFSNRLTNSFKLISIARQSWRNSKISSRRSPISIFETKDCGSLIWSAKSCCLSPISHRISLSKDCKIYCRVPTWMARLSRLKLSTNVSSRNRFPSNSWSAMKSMLQLSLVRLALGRVTRTWQLRFRRGRLRRIC